MSTRSASVNDAGAGYGVDAGYGWRRRRWMPGHSPDRPEPTVPLEVLRDLVAIARALYRVERDSGKGDPVRLQELEEVGKGLREAIDFAKLGANTLGGRAAPANAAKYTARLCALVDSSTPLEPALRAVAEKLMR